MTDTVDPRLQTRATELFGVRFPIVQTGLGWVAGASLVSGTANAGGLGILAAATMTFGEMVEAIDEVHERTVQGDFLMAILREALAARRGSLKLVLMSATMNAEAVGEYFGGCAVVRGPPGGVHRRRR